MTLSGRLQGKVAIVTGAGSGIGEAVALRFAREGARVIGVGITDNVKTVAKRAEGEMEGRLCDVSNPTAVEALMTHCRERYGQLDVLVNNAGIAPKGFPRLHEASLEQWDAVMAVNERGVFISMKYALPLMIASGGGAIANMASVGSFRASANSSAYLTSKGGLLMMTRAAAVEYRADKIRVNAVCPGMTRTPLLDGVTDEQMQRLLARTPGIRLTEPEEVANLTLFLCSDEASAITGAAYIIDSGRCAQG
jgi:NAD(P)-dependent dehydrogenase (short-subunit alcohol dehydrogenase family)